MSNGFSSFERRKRLIDILKIIHFLSMMFLFAISWETGYKITLVSSFPYLGDIGIVILYFVLMSYLFRIYECLHVGKVKVTEMIIGQGLAYLIGIMAFYTVYFFYYRNFFNPLPLIAIMALQTLISAIWCYLVNRLYYELIKPAISLVFYSRKSQIKRLLKNRDFTKHYNVVKYIDITTIERDSIPDYLDGIHVVFCCTNSHHFRDRCFNECMIRNIKLYYMPDTSDLMFDNSGFSTYFNIPIMSVEIGKATGIYNAIKRFFDLSLSLLAFMITIPLHVAISVVIKVSDGGPVLYKQTRLTLDGKEFQIYKFRSMVVDAEKDGIARLANDNDSRITPVGQFIRRYRLDELPQLINIIKGDMSIVGPRPERPEISKEYEKKYPNFRLRLRAKAGLTGLAQVYGQYNTEPLDKLKMDIIYINHMSLRTDLLIILLTVKALLKKESTEAIDESQINALMSDEKI